MGISTEPRSCFGKGQSTLTVCSDGFGFNAAQVAIGQNIQGAPIVPIVERDLFQGHAFYLNLGGVGNISIHAGGNIEAFDVHIGAFLSE